MDVKNGLKTHSFHQHVNGIRHIADDEWISGEANESKRNVNKSWLESGISLRLCTMVCSNKQRCAFLQLSYYI